MYNIQHTKAGKYIVKGGGRDWATFETEVEATQWIGKKHQEYAAAQERKNAQDAFDRQVTGLNLRQLRWQNWRSWFYSELDHAMKKAEKALRAFEGMNPNASTYHKKADYQSRDMDEISRAKDLYHRAVAVDTKVKQARSQKDPAALETALVEAESMINEMQGYFGYAARPE